MTLTWFLAASNRELRDRATKALVALLWKRLPLLVELLSHFDSVDDPYIAERLYPVAYGCALSTEDAAGLETLAGTVFDKVFAEGKPPVHIMLRDYARGVVEASADRGVLPPRVSLDLVRPPYVSPWPVRPPSLEQLERQAPRETHSGLYVSLTSLIGDFARYTVGSAVRGFEAPNQPRRRRQERQEARRALEEAAPPTARQHSLDSELQTLLNQMQLQPSPPLPETPVTWSER